MSRIVEKVASLPWTAIGDLTLLANPFMFPVRLTRRKTVPQHEQEIAQMVERARRGEVPVCGFLSPGEKELERRLRQEPHARWIKTVAHGLPPRFDPTVEDSRFLAEGRQLLLSSFPVDVPVFPVNYDNCHLMNARNEELCKRATADSGVRGEVAAGIGHSVYGRVRGAVAAGIGHSEYGGVCGATPVDVPKEEIQ